VRERGGPKEIRMEAKRKTPTVETKGGARGKKKNRGEGEKRFPKDLYAISENYRDLSVKQNFPSIQNPNEEMPKMKVGEFFKLCNIALGLKFKNSKLISLQVKF
jgi:hypothetical protein